MVVAEKEIERFSKVVKKALGKGDLNGAMSALELCAELRYRENQIIYDPKLEDYLLQIVKKLNVQGQNSSQRNMGSVLFYDGFGLDYRGLSYIYVQALVKLHYRVILVLDGRHRTDAEKMENLVKKTKGDVFYLREDTHVKWCREFEKIYIKYKPATAFLYTSPYDVAAFVSFKKILGVTNTFLINSTDQEYWLGTEITDYVIEFRNYGASISKEYRKISTERLIKLPFYPFVDETIEFQGYPFEHHSGEIVIFSGGQLYKTKDEYQTYYKIVQNVLKKHINTVFWYARGGVCEELAFLQEMFPGRVFHTKERSDLMQVLKHSDIYLNTYPIAGGLMMQYSALAGRVPVGLRTIADEADDILINQEKHKVFFDTVDELQKELDSLITDSEYRQMRNAEIQKGTVITEHEFVEQLKKIIDMHCSDYRIQWKYYPIKELLEIYNRINRGVTNKFFWRYTKKHLLRYKFMTIIMNDIKYIILKIKDSLELRWVHAFKNSKNR